MTRSSSVRFIAGSSSAARNWMLAPACSRISRILVPPRPMTKPTMFLDTTNRAREVDELRGPGRGAGALFPGVYRKSSSLRFSRSANSCNTAMVMTTADKICSCVPFTTTGLSGMPTMASLPTSMSAPEDCITSLIFTPFVPIMAPTAQAGTMRTRILSSSGGMSWLLHSSRKINLQASSFWGSEPATVTILSDKLAGASCSPEIRTTAPDAASQAVALPSTKTVSSASRGSRHRHGMEKRIGRQPRLATAAYAKCRDPTTIRTTAA
mmetsp:Transcript_111185/g.321406  ORF Transcript_111185/g.321406 Transcript_111185/m.321406 type:complete len:267 (-) Transcript_111185:15-815(-)